MAFRFFGKGDNEVMNSPFAPPGITSLADVDISDAKYESRCIAIQGVVSPTGQAGWDGVNGGYKVHYFSLEAWRPLDEPIVNRSLARYLRPVPPDAECFDDFPTYSIQRMSVLVSTDRTRAVLERMLPMDSQDDALQAIAIELQKPVIIQTNRFGDLVLDRRIDRFEGSSVWNGVSIRISFEMDEHRSIDKPLKTAESMFADQLAWKRRIDAYAVQKLKENVWLEEDEEPPTTDQFVARLKLESITFLSEDEFEFWHDDGNLFWGHSIQVSGNLKDGPTSAEIHG